VALGAASILWATGCRCSADRPYTPFHIEPKKPAPSASASATAGPPAASAEAAKTARQAALAPKDVSEWTVDGIAIGVPPERLIERALTADLDGDGQPEALAWTRSRTEAADAETTGELLLVGPKAPPPGRVIAKIPSFVPAGPGCHHTVSLAQTGPQTVTLDIAARCDAAFLPRSPTRGVAVLSPGRDPVAMLELRLADPAPGETLSVAVDSADRDADGRDDVRVTVGIGADGNAPEVTADLVWLDRTAGPSRDAAEPAHSLAAIAGRGSGKITNRQVPARTASARRLYATICAESGTSRLFDADGAAFPCSGIAGALSTLFIAEVRAAIQRRDAPGAIASLARDGWYQGPLTAKQREGLEKDLSAAWPRRGTSERLLEPVPRAKSGLPRFSPLTFDADGMLLVQTQDGVFRVHPEDGRAEDVRDAMEGWPLAVGAGAAPRWTGIAFPCERSEVALLESDATGTPLPSKPTRLIAPRPGPCGHATRLPTPSLAPVEWTDARQAGLIGGAFFGVSDVAELGPAPQKGAPRSPDGKILVVPSPFGVVVATGPKAELWAAQDGLALSDCVVANGAARVACVRADRAVLLSPEPKLLRK
jgi:hypothetical protein